MAINGQKRAFVLELDSSWVLIAAGHVAKEIAKDIASDATLSWRRLVDVFAGKSLPSIPIAFEPSEWAALEEDGTDYAALPLNRLYRAALHAADVMPLTANDIRTADLRALRVRPGDAVPQTFVA